MDQDTERLRAEYMKNPPEGMTLEDIRNMSTDDLLDMDYFLHEDVLGEDSFGHTISYGTALCKPQNNILQRLFYRSVDTAQFLFYKIFFCHTGKKALSN